MEGGREEARERMRGKETENTCMRETVLKRTGSLNAPDAKGIDNNQLLYLCFNHNPTVLRIRIECRIEY